MSLLLTYSNLSRLNTGVVFNSWAILESRRLVQVIPEDVRILWNKWEIRVLVLVSLTLQLCLLHFGCRRRYSAKTWLRVFLWLSYLGADSVAVIALGVISNNQGNCDVSLLQNELTAFWSPFLLLHLGGQDTITAYAVQDNELWLRHLLGLVVQSGLALYIILQSWKVSWLSFLTIPLFIAGFIKYAERIWALKSANNVWPSDRPSDRRRLGSLGLDWNFMNSALGLDGPVSNFPRRYIIGIFGFFKVFRCLFLNQKAELRSYERSYSDFSDSQTAWNLIEGELGFAYDLYYTKAPLFFTTWGFLIRTFSFTSILLVFVLFLIKECHEQLFVDLIVTYLLLVGAILIEIYGVVLLCISDWPIGRFGDRRSLDIFIMSLRRRCAKLTSKQSWSNSMCQLDLLGLCLKDMSVHGGGGILTVFSNFRGWALDKMLAKLNRELVVLIYMTRKKVSDEVKDCVFRTFLPERGWDSNGFVAEKYNRFVTDGTECIGTYQRIIIWHIATDLCFYTDGVGGESNSLRAVSKELSDYMMYVLAMLPLVLSSGSAKLILERTCNDVKDCIESYHLSSLSVDRKSVV